MFDLDWQPSWNVADADVDDIVVRVDLAGPEV